MSDNELLLAISNMMDKKLQPIKTDIEQIKARQTRTELLIENDIKDKVNLLVETFIPSAERNDKATSKIKSIETDVNILKLVVAEHSERLQKLA